jgi:hypothetical protein
VDPEGATVRKAFVAHLARIRFVSCRIHR